MALAFFENVLVLVRGGGDLASGTIYRLRRVGFPVVVTELPTPKLVRRTVSYGEAVYGGTVTVEGITARLVKDVSSYRDVLEQEEVPVICDSTKCALEALRPVILVDARMEKCNPDTAIADASLVIALGPGYTAGVDCHAVIETNRGHYLGRVIYEGTAELDSGVPGEIDSKSRNRVLRAPANGHVEPFAAIGDTIEAGQIVGMVNGQQVVAPFKGVLRGLVHPRLKVAEGTKIGDLDPRAKRDHCFTISDKSLAVGGGVIETVFSAPQVRAYLQGAKDHGTPSSI